MIKFWTNITLEEAFDHAGIIFIDAAEQRKLTYLKERIDNMKDEYLSYCEKSFNYFEDGEEI